MSKSQNIWQPSTLEELNNLAIIYEYGYAILSPTTLQKAVATLQPRHGFNYHLSAAFRKASVASMEARLGMLNAGAAILTRSQIQEQINAIDRHREAAGVHADASYREKLATAMRAANRRAGEHVIQRLQNEIFTTHQIPQLQARAEQQTAAGNADGQLTEKQQQDIAAAVQDAQRRLMTNQRTRFLANIRKPEKI